MRVRWVIWEPARRLHDCMKSFIGRLPQRMFRNTSSLAILTSRRRPLRPNKTAKTIHYPLLTIPGIKSQWTSLSIFCPQRYSIRNSTHCLSLKICCPNNATLSPQLPTPKRKALPNSISMRSIISMAYLDLLSRAGIQSLLAHFGGLCRKWWEWI